MNARAKKYFAINIVILLMIVSIYLATNAAMLQNVFAQVGQSPIYKGNAQTITFLISSQDDFQQIVNVAQLGKETGIKFTIAVTEEQLNTQAESIQSMSKMGHEIILQGMIDSQALSQEQVRNQLREEIHCYQKVMGKEAQYYLPFRLQATNSIKRVCKDQGINVVLFSQDARAIVHKNDQEFSKTLINQIRQGDFVYLDVNTITKSQLESVKTELDQTELKNQNMTQALID